MRRFALACVLAMSSTTSTTLAGEADKAPAPEDRFLWLEEVSGDKPLEWAKARNAESAKVLVTPEEAALEKRILDILDSKERIPNVEKLGPWYYNFWRDAKNPRGLWRRTTLAEYRKPEPAWETVIDVDALGAAEKENWFWHGADCLRPEYERCIVQLSRGGADADVVREFDLVAKTFVKDGFYLPESKNSVSWLDADRLYVGTDFGKGSMTTSGYPRVAKIWKRGTPIEQAETLYEGKAEDVAVAAFRDHTKGFERDFVNRAVTFYSDELFVRRDGKLVKIDKPDSAERQRPPRPAAARAARRLGGGRQDLSRRGAARRRLRGLPEGRAALRRAVRADRSALAAGLQPDAPLHPGERARQREEPGLRARPQGRQVDARAAARACPSSAPSRRPPSTTRSRTTTS